jgi:hypothetical protein
MDVILQKVGCPTGSILLDSPVIGVPLVLPYIDLMIFELQRAGLTVNMRIVLKIKSALPGFPTQLLMRNAVMIRQCFQARQVPLLKCIALRMRLLI